MVQLSAGHFPALFISALAGKYIDLSQLGEGETFGLVNTILNLCRRKVRNKFTEVGGAHLATWHREFHDPVESSRPPQDSRVQSCWNVGGGDNDDSFLRSQAVQAIQQVRQTDFGWRQLRWHLRKGAVDILKHNQRRSVVCGELKHSFEIVVIGLLAKQGNRAMEWPSSLPLFSIARMTLVFPLPGGP